MIRVEITRPAALDIDGILQTSKRDFGAQAALRYEFLIATAIESLRTNPRQSAVKSSVETASGVCWLHLRAARKLAPAHQRIAKPRHILVFKVETDRLTILRVLHDAMDLSARLAAPD